MDLCPTKLLTRSAFIPVGFGLFGSNTGGCKVLTNEDVDNQIESTHQESSTSFSPRQALIVSIIDQQARQ